MQFLLVTENHGPDYLPHDWQLISSLHQSQTRPRRVSEAEEISQAIPLYRFWVNTKGVMI